MSTAAGIKSILPAPHGFPCSAQIIFYACNLAEACVRYTRVHKYMRDENGLLEMDFCFDKQYSNSDFIQHLQNEEREQERGWKLGSDQTQM